MPKVIRLSASFIACWIMLILASPGIHAQDKMPVQFGKVTPADFAVTAAGLDSSADAVVVADFGTSTFVKYKGSFHIEFYHSKRIRVLTKKGFDAATISIWLYASDRDAEKLQGLKASTYTLEGGKVVETRLDSKSIFENKVGRNQIEEKFTFPALKEGAILEYSYTQYSPFIFNLQPWAFQSEYPTLWSEYQADIPDFFKYVTLSQGYLPFKVNTTGNRNQTNIVITSSGSNNIDYNVVTHRWVMANIPALKEEPFSTTVLNYLAKIEFQMSGIQYPGGTYHDEMGTWKSLSEALLNNNGFGADLGSGNSWLDDDMKTITAGATGSLEIARKIYCYVRDNFTCTSNSGLTLTNPLKTVYKTRSGNVADLNLLLTAMLIHAGIQTDPVILSTRDHGFTHQVYPLLNRFNYVVSQVVIDSTAYYLDASDRWLGFGRLPQRCYNGYARVIDKDNPSYVVFDANSKTQGKTTLVAISNDEKGGQIGQFQSSPGYDEALEMRHTIKEHGQGEYLKNLQTSWSGDAMVSNLEFDSLLQPEQPLQMVYEFRLTADTTANVYYFNPMMGEGYRENPFKSAERRYPVEMPYPIDNTYTLDMEIPKGYMVDEMPKSAKVLYNTDEGVFEYLIQKDDQQIQFRSRLKLLKATYAPEDYASLRDFFAFVVKKESEQIVFKKKK
jgi:Domain of Unknown Function with PDB structure (DUF3857)/Domain of Unknown Function with PDB structure (DUF3858)/Transglutaminase-like superfamily